MMMLGRRTAALGGSPASASALSRRSFACGSAVARSSQRGYKDIVVSSPAEHVQLVTLNRASWLFEPVTRPATD